MRVLALVLRALYPAAPKHATTGLGKGRTNPDMGHMTDKTRLEEQIAHLTRTVEDLSDVVARQEGEISKLTYRVRMLIEREASREMDTGGTIPLADQKPPHW